ncbi:DMT family transporter [Pseudoalteromonas sp. SG44-1]|uniref:DMT family transporter n=1 Tax=Pseudoalteromonas sp. SG44-1 TaxID=2760964 RepID=UPI001601ACFF|nr:DMT family transporter [Pseudoalteromonas sp. SG44-1]MBB1417728.1 DMT family transporter [Pseudoalteromonas sp. SG44-1]
MAALLRPSMFMLLSTFTLALNSLFSKLLTEYFSDAILVMLRLLLPALVMLFIAACSRWVMPNQAAWGAFILRAIFIASCQGCFMLALSRLTLIEAVVLFSTGPLFIPLLERYFYKTKISRMVLPTLILMGIGVVMQNLTVQGITWRWELLIGLAAGFFIGCSQVALFRASKINLPILVINGCCFAIAALFVLPVMVIFTSQVEYQQSIIMIVNFEQGILLLLLFLGLSTAATQFFRSKAYRLVDSNSQLAPLIYTNLIFAVLFQFLFFSTVMSLMQILGTSLIAFATLLNTFGSYYYQWFKAQQQIV